MNVYADLRCLQDPNYAFRGVGHHTAALLRHARKELPGLVRLLALLDESLPSLPEPYRDLVDECRYGSNPRAGHELSLLFQPSPMTHEQGRLAPLLRRREMLACAVIYDFIPLDVPRYLPTPASRIAYLTNLVWLKSYHRFAPISEYAARRLREVVAPAVDAVCVTGAALRDTFADFNPADHRSTPHCCRFPAGKYFVMVGGGDPRKNTECLLSAHARLAQGQAQPPGLVVVGELPAGQREQFRAFYHGQGGKADLLEFAQGLADAQLALLYHRALAAVCPSRIEGFGLPVVEAMAAGCPVLASRIEAHEELVDQPEALFSPDDPGQLAERMRALWIQPACRQALADRQRPVAARFAEQAVAQRFWSLVRRGCPPRRPAMARPGSARKPRLAFLTPFPPHRSGVATYSARSFESLGKLADVDVFTDAPVVAPYPGVRRFAPLSELPYVRGEHDRVIAVVGNCPVHHARIVDYHCRYGGACLVHDNRLADFYHARLGARGFAAMASRSLRRPVSVEECCGWLQDQGLLPTMFFDDLLPGADPLLVHSRGIQAHVQRLYGHAARHLPFCCYRHFSDYELSPQARAEAAGRLGLPTGRVAIITLGALSITKGPFECLWALEQVLAWGMPADLYLVGSFVMPGLQERMVELADRLAIRDHVHVMKDWVTDQMYRDFLVAGDFAIQLRTHGFGGLSGALLDCISAGLPTVANEDLAEAMDGPDYVLRVPDNLSPPLIAERMQIAYEAGRHRLRIGPERDRYVEEYSFDRYARRMLEVLEVA